MSLLEGPALAMGMVAATGVAGLRDSGADLRWSLAVAVGGAGIAGVIDDLAEDTPERSRGFRGHLGAIRRGQITTGSLKMAGIGLSAAISASVVSRNRSRASVEGPPPLTLRAIDIAVDTVLIAGSANLINLFDLRPGRALKAAALLIAPMAATPASSQAALLWGAACAVGPADLAARDMAGDTGANALGALAGHAWASGAPRSIRLVAATALVAMNLVSEQVSFSGVIRRHGLLRRIDEWGQAGPRSHADGPGDER